MTDRAIATADCNSVGQAFCGERDRHGFAKALTTDAGRAWLKLHDECKDRARSLARLSWLCQKLRPTMLPLPPSTATPKARSIPGRKRLLNSPLSL